MLVAQAINVEEDADGLLKMEARAKIYLIVWNLLQATCCKLSREPFGLAVSTLSAPNAAVTKMDWQKPSAARLEDTLAKDAEAEAEAEAIISTPLLDRVLF